MEKQFIRAKSQENKNIRIQQIMDVTDRLFHEKTYHEITLSVIAEEVNLARGGLYKYVSSKEEIFLMIYLQKQDAMLKDIVRHINNIKITPDVLSEVMSKTIHNHLDFIKYHQILNAIIETNVTIEKLAEFKLKTYEQTTELFTILQKVLNKDRNKVFDLYMTILYHCVYLYDRVAYQKNYVEAMRLAGLEIEDIDFEEHLSHFIYTILYKG